MVDVSKLIYNATKAPPKGKNIETVDRRLYAQIKALCKVDSSMSKEIARYLLVDLKNKSIIVRIRSLCIIDVLFWRSKVFRHEINQSIRTIGDAGEFLYNNNRNTNDTNQSTSSNYSGCMLRDLQEKIKLLILLWDASYGMYLPQIRTFVRYLRESLKLPMPDIHVRFTATS